MRIKLVSLLVLSSFALLMTGCDKGRSQMGHRETQLLGVAKLEKSNYTPSGINTVDVETDELYSRKNFSGDKVTLFWGLITLKDY